MDRNEMHLRLDGAVQELKAAISRGGGDLEAADTPAFDELRGARGGSGDQAMDEPVARSISSAEAALRDGRGSEAVEHLERARDHLRK